MATFRMNFRMVWNGTVDVEASNEEEAGEKMASLDPAVLSAGSEDLEVEVVGCSELARPDPDGTARPRTELVAHVDPSHCVGPGVLADEYRPVKPKA